MGFKPVGGGNSRTSSNGGRGRKHPKLKHQLPSLNQEQPPTPINQHIPSKRRNSIQMWDKDNLNSGNSHNDFRMSEQSPRNYSQQQQTYQDPFFLEDPTNSGGPFHDFEGENPMGTSSDQQDIYTPLIGTSVSSFSPSSKISHASNLVGHIIIGGNLAFIEILIRHIRSTEGFFSSLIDFI